MAIGQVRPAVVPQRRIQNQMYHFLVSYNGWSMSNDSINMSRAFEYTEDSLRQFYKPNGIFDIVQISKIPALFASETGGSGAQVAQVGYINHISRNGRNVDLRYTFDSSIPPIKNQQLEQLFPILGIESFELSRTHWAIKDVDLFRALYENQVGKIVSPKLFSIDNIHSIEDDLLSIMMPFSGDFKEVNITLQQMADSLDLRCLRADDIWENDAVIQDIVSLICRSKIVICDCTGRNPNVFYEIGIAHSLGKDVILITQSAQDIPFDLRHLRYLRYLNNNEGRKNLSEQLSKKVATIIDY